MGRTILGIVLAAVAVFVWGFVYWGLSPLPYTSCKQSNGDEAAQAALLKHFPDNGTYHIPPPVRRDQLVALYKKGPIAFVHITSRDGRPLHNPEPMLYGLLLYFIVAAVLAPLLRSISSALQALSSQIRISFLFGLVAALLIDMGDVVWWDLSLEWTLHTAVYYMSSMVIMIPVLAHFVVDRQEAQ